MAHVYLKHTKSANISICRLRMVVLTISMQQKYFTASNLNSSEQSHIGSLFINAKQKKIGSRRNWHTCWLVHDVSDTDLWIQNGSGHGHVYATFKRWFLTNQTISRVKNYSECILFHFLDDIDRWSITTFFFASLLQAVAGSHWFCTPNWGRGCLMSPPCLEFQGWQLIVLYYLLFCSIPIAFSVLSFFLPTGPSSWPFSRKIFSIFR